VVLATLELADAEERVHDQHQIEPLDHAADALMPHGFSSCQSKQKQRSKLKINDGDGALQPGPPTPIPSRYRISDCLLPITDCQSHTHAVCLSLAIFADPRSICASVSLLWTRRIAGIIYLPKGIGGAGLSAGT